MNESGWLTVKEAAGAMGVAPATVYDMVEKSAITYYRVGAGKGRIVFRPADVASYLDSRRVVGGADRTQEIKSASRHLRPPSPSRRPS